MERTGANNERGLYLRKDAPPIQLIDVLQCIQKTNWDAPIDQAKTAKDDWYERSYPIFASSSARDSSPDGLVTVMAYAASWIAGVPSCRPTQERAVVDQLIASLDRLLGGVKMSATKRTELRRHAIAKGRLAFGLRNDTASIVLLSSTALL